MSSETEVVVIPGGLHGKPEEKGDTMKANLEISTGTVAHPERVRASGEHRVGMMYRQEGFLTAQGTRWKTMIGAATAAAFAAIVLWSCSNDRLVDIRGIDLIPPAAIADLEIGCVTSGSVELTWTAPGDDGMAGRAAAYDIRYYTGPIDSVTWKIAIACAVEIAPNVAGSAESYTLVDLSPDTPYFFAIRAMDEASNRGGLSNSAHTQTHDIDIVTWARDYGGPSQEGGLGNVHIIPAPDGGYVLGGETSSYGDNLSNFYFLKVDEYGNQIWHGWYGYPRANNPFGFAPTTDGGYIIVGVEGDIAIFDEDILVAKIDGSGNLVWERTYGDSTIDISDYGSSIAAVPSGGYIVGGETESVEPAGGCLVRIDESGEVIWWKTYPGTGTPSCVAVTADGGFIAGGLGGNVIETDGTGNLLWSKVMETAMILYSVAPAEDGGHIVTGYTHGLSDAYVAEVNGLGEVIWDHTYGGAARDRAYSVCRAHCSGYVVAGGTRSSGSGEDDVWIFKIDESGNLLWERVYGGPNIEYAQSVAATPDGGYIVSGKTMSFGNGVQLWLLKVDDEGRLFE